MSIDRAYYSDVNTGELIAVRAIAAILVQEKRMKHGLARISLPLCVVRITRVNGVFDVLVYSESRHAISVARRALSAEGVI